MTDKQKEAIILLNRIKETKTATCEAIMTDEQYFMLLEFIIENNTEIQYVPQPTPWTTPLQQPYYGTGTPEIYPYRVTCEYLKDQTIQSHVNTDDHE